MPADTRRIATGSEGGFGTGANNGGWRPGGQNRLVFNEEVDDPTISGGGNTSYNPATGKSHYISYENDPIAPVAPTSPAAKTGAPKSSSSKPKAAAKPVAKAKTPAPVGMSAPSAPAAPSGITGGISGGGGGAVSMPSASMEALTGGSGGGGVGGNGDEAGSGVLFSPSRFRQGIGTRMLPQESASLAALRKIY